MLLLKWNFSRILTNLDNHPAVFIFSAVRIKMKNVCAAYSVFYYFLLFYLALVFSLLLIYLCFMFVLFIYLLDLSLCEFLHILKFLFLDHKCEVK